jgi:glycine/D-amino acid oxidase-like deaminating enzyme
MESITERRDLRTGMTVWEATPSAQVATEPLVRAMKVDVVIVGAGISGALMAAAATARGMSTIVIDRRPPGHGSTAASTALLLHELDTPLIELAEMLGLDRAARVWLRSLRAVQDLASLIRQAGIGCDFRPRRSLYLSGNGLDAAGMAKEHRLRRSIGLPTSLLDHRQLQGMIGIDREAALLSEGSAEADPRLLTIGLLQRAMARGCRVFSPAELAAVAPSSRSVEMVTSEGVELAAGALVFATGYELADGVPSAGHRRTSTFVLATPPQPGAIWSQGELIWEASDRYLYIRSTTDGRVIVGGEDEDFSDDAKRDALLPGKIRALQEKIAMLLPRLDIQADFAWSGTFGESDRGLPSIGAIPGMPNCHAVLGYGGNGITFAMMAAQIIAGELSGGRDSDAELFAFAG